MVRWAVSGSVCSMAARTLQDLVSAAASVHSDRVAVTYDSGSPPGCPVSLSYRELVELAGELSGALRESCCLSGGIIGLYGGDDALVPVWILGILQSGAAYVPLDPEAPGLLSARIMNQCGLKYCAVKTDLQQQFQTTLTKHVTVEILLKWPKFKLTLTQIKQLSADPLQGAIDNTRDRTAGGADHSDVVVLEKGIRCPDLAYVLHTSGTTGFPKTVRVPHRCILPNLLHLRSLFQMSEDDVVFLASPLTFDPSVIDIFLALSSGARLLIVPNVIKKIPNQLARLLFRDHKTTVLQVTPTLLLRFGHRLLGEEVLSCSSSLRVLALGGEACPSPAVLRSWRHQDNKTHIYNIYGITEVSCWASCYRIPETVLQSSSLTEFTVPLGSPLKDTVVEVRGEDGRVVTEGEGQVFIGGDERVCLLDGEDAVVPGTMRASGDWVKVEDSQLYYLGRRDRMIKRHGKRVNLDTVQELMQGLPQVESCAVGLHGGSRLIAFIVAPTSAHQKAAPASSSVQQHADRSPPGPRGDLNRLVQNQLSALLPSHGVPDALVLVPALSLTPHGKVDLKALMKIYEKQRRCLESFQGDASKLEQTLQALWRDSLGLPAGETVDQESNFLLGGGDSLKALRLNDEILTAVGRSSPELLEVILGGTFSEVLCHVTRMTQSEGLSRKRHADPPSEVLAKKEREGATAAEKRTFKVIRRASEVMEITCRDAHTDASTFQADELIEKNRGGDVEVGLSLSWSSDTGRCVDASPVLLVHQGSDAAKVTVFIGSHSHRVQAVDLHTGGLHWERVLGGRIEASAAVSRCGSLVILGCYDSYVYFLCSESGGTRWMFKTGDAVKSCPAVDPLTGLVVVGSHDGHVYALDPQARHCAWKRHCGGGGVFSSPHLRPSQRRLYVASLGGRLLCLNLDSGDVLWSHCRDVPFFSSPNSVSAHVVIGSVDGNICCFDSSGELLWQFLTEAPVFSSPCITPDQQRLLCGSHDGRLYCLSCADGALQWTFQTEGRVYATPCVFEGSVGGDGGPLVALASTEGTLWVLDGRDGRMLTSHKLPGELFSSPVTWGSSLVIGCRNDYLYCLELNVRDKK